MQVMQGAQGGAALLQPPSRGASQGVGGRTTVPAGAERGATATSGRVALRRAGARARPRDRGGGGRPSRAEDGGVAPRRHTGPGSGPREGLRGGHIATGRRPSAAPRHTGGPGVG